MLATSTDSALHCEAMATRTPAPQTSADRAGPYLFYVLGLSFFALAIMVALAFAPIDPATRSILDGADNVICTLFLIDFAVTLWRTDRKLHYFMRWGWIDLLSSIPSVDALRWGRSVRALRVLRILRGVRAARIISDFAIRRRAHSTLMAAALITLLLMTVSSVAILQLESGPNANIRTPEDAVWWSISTITTVGYGDRYPTTTDGRIVAAALMIAGVGLFGVFSGSMAAWFLQPDEAQVDSDLQSLRDEVRLLRDEIAALRQDHT